MQGNPIISPAGYMQKVLQGKDQGVLKNGIFVKGNILRLDEREFYDLNGPWRFVSNHFGITWCNSLDRTIQILLGKLPFSVLLCSYYYFLRLYKTEFF